MLAISTGYYDTLKFFHVLAATTWVGSAIYAQALATKVRGRVTRHVWPPPRRTSVISASG